MEVLECIHKEMRNELVDFLEFLLVDNQIVSDPERK